MRKERIQEVVDELPEEVDIDEQMEKLYCPASVESGRTLRLG